MGAKRMTTCGCRVLRQDREPIEFCPLHTAAPELLEACRVLVGRFENLHDYSKLDAEAIKVGYAAINKAVPHA